MTNNPPKDKELEGTETGTDLMIVFDKPTSQEQVNDLVAIDKEPK